MANVDRPNGFRAVKTESGADFNGMIRHYEVAARAADSTNNHGDIYVGDPVKIGTDGAVEVADTGDTVLGVVVGVGVGTTTHGEVGLFDPATLTKRSIDYDATGIVAVAPAKDVLFEVQTSADLDLVQGAEADISTAAGTAHGDRSTGLSSAELIAVAVPGSSDVIVVEDNTSPDNDTSLTNARHIVKFVNV